MPSSLIGNGGGSTIADAVAQLRAMGDPQTAFSSMYENNAEFRQFADSMRGKMQSASPEEREKMKREIRQMLDM